MRIDSSHIGVRAPMPVVMRLRFPLPAPNIPIGPPVYLRRVPSIAGLGDTATEALAKANIVRDFNSYTGNLAYDVEQGQVVSPDVMAAGLRDRVSEVCNSTLSGDPACDPAAFNAQITQLASQYAQALSDQQQKTAALVAAGSISVPAGYYGGHDLYDPNYSPAQYTAAPAPPAATPASAPAPTPSPAASSPAPTPSPAPASTSTSSSTSSSGPATTGAIVSWFKQTTLTNNAFGGYVQNWMVVAAAAGLAMWFMSQRGRR